MTSEDDALLRDGWTWRGPADVPRLHLLGNGRISSWIAESGGGALRFRDYALTRWHPDPTLDEGGLWLYLRDDADGRTWRLGTTDERASSVAPSARCYAERVAIEQREAGIFARLEVAIAPREDVELRRIAIVNETSAPRALTLTSFAEVALALPLDDERHPAFSKLFVGAEWLSESNALLFTRRPRNAGERVPALAHRALALGGDIAFAGYEADRGAFLGRAGDERRPHGVHAGLTARTGFTLDPCFALALQIRLAPHARAEVGFLTSAGETREAAFASAARFSTREAMADAWAQAAASARSELARLGIAPARLPALQTLASALIVPGGPLGCAPALRRENRLGQPALWQLGVSGDLPILLVQPGERQRALLDLLGRARSLWQARGLAFDLVVAHAGPPDLLREALAGDGEAPTPGGRVHFVDVARTAPELQRLLAVCARAVMSGERELDAQVAAPRPVEPARPSARSEGGAAAPAPEPAPREPLQFDNGLGGFAADGRSYVIRLAPGQTTPAPWSNLLANDEFGCLVTESGTSCSWSLSSGENLLTPWSNDPVCDAPGEALYLRDEESGEIWSVTPRPAGPESACEIRHGAGFTSWRRETHGLVAEQRAFVPWDAPVAVVQLRLENRTPRTRRISATRWAEWLLGALPSVSREHVVVDTSPDGQALLARNPWSPDFAEREAFLTATLPARGVCGDRREFFGAGGRARPDALSRAQLSGRVQPGGDPGAALQVLLELAPGGSAECAFVLGQGRDRAHSLALAAEWREPLRCARADAERERAWDRALGALEVRTPDAAFDLLANRWLLQQALASRLLARAGFHQAGGAYGFRDQIQDVLALLFADPARARAHLLRCAAHQFEVGDVLHWWHPHSERGVRTRCSDDLLWLPWAVARYVCATGDIALLSESAPLLRAAELGAGERDRYARFDAAGESVSVYEHCARALERGATRGRHGLPLIGACDWNDGFDRLGARGLGESVWLGWFALSALREFAELAERTQRGEDAQRWRARAEEIEEAIARSAWDGAWYLRAWDDDGHTVGSHADDECRIDSIAQSWAVLSGARTGGRAREAVRAARRELAQGADGLVRLSWPPFADTPREPGYVKAYPPGIRENGGQYAHAAAWLGWACARLGDGDAAWEIFERIHPIHRAATPQGIKTYRAEPYVLAADVYSAPPHVGRGGWTWYTGAAGWTWRFGVEGILGLQLVDGALALEPCLPSHWPGFEARVRSALGSLAIRVRVDGALAAGARVLTIDGAEATDTPVAFPTDGSERSVELRMGRRAPEGSAAA